MTNKYVEGEVYLKHDQLDERIRVYALHWIATGSKKDAYMKAGYATESGAYQFHRAHSKKIDKYVWDNGFRDNAPLAINTLVDVLINGSTDGSRIKAAIEILDRGGFNKTDKLALKDESSAKLEDQDINRQIQDLIRDTPVALKSVK
jgi:hypothetical protein